MTDQDLKDLTHHRTVTWEDPTATIQATKEMDGLACLQAIQAGTLPPPPLANLLGMTLQNVAKESVTFTIEAAEYLYNPLGTVHGGVLSTLLDSAMGCVVQANLQAGIGYTTVELKVNFLRPVTAETGLLFARSEIIHMGKRTALAEARITDEAGKVYAHGTSTCIILRP